MEHPAAAVGGNGRQVFAWVNFWEDPVSGSVFARIYDSSGFPQAPEFRVNQYSDYFQGEPAVAMDGQGNIVIAWQSWEQDGDAFGIYARLFDPSGFPLGPEFLVNSQVQDSQMHPALAVGDSGKVNKETLKKQLELSGQLDFLDQPYHKAIMNDEIPLSVGGGIGQSRTMMMLLKKAHLGEVSVTVWPDELKEVCEERNIVVLE